MCRQTLNVLYSVICEDQLNLVLVKLVEYLGSESMITSAAAFAEVRETVHHDHTFVSSF